MKILIAGAGGMIGKAFSESFEGGAEIVALTRGELDVTDPEAVRRIIRRENPQVIINCAVLGVDVCEADPPRARSVNVEGAENLARAAADVGAELVHLSTNYVFDGERTDGSFYEAADWAEPVNVYGATKLAGERAAQAALPRSLIVRTSWVFGAGKESFFREAPRLLKAGRPVRAVSDLWASATYIDDLVARVAEIIRYRRGGIYHVVNSGLCSHFDFALEAARILGLSEAEQKQLIEPVRSADLGRLARRPRFTPMRCRLSDEIGIAPMRDWRTALAAFIEDEGLAAPRNKSA